MFSKSSEKLEASALQEVDDSVTEFRSALSKWKYPILIIGFCFTVAVIVAVILKLLPCQYFDQIRNAPNTTVILDPQKSEENSLRLGNVRFITRNEWGAQPPTEQLDKLQHPVPYVIISHTATEFCKNHSECTFRVRFAQTFHIESRGWSDIAYNFLIGGDGYVYVGRGWDYVGAHAFNYNRKSIGISFIGKFDNEVPPKHQLHAAQELIEIGVQNGAIVADYKLLGHRQVSATLSPGDALFDVLKTWPHWSPIP